MLTVVNQKISFTMIDPEDPNAKSKMSECVDKRKKRAGQTDASIGAGAIQQEGNYEPDAFVKAQGWEILLSLLRGWLRLFRNQLDDFL